MIKILILRLFDLFKVALLVKTFLFSYYSLFPANHRGHSLTTRVLKFSDILLPQLPCLFCVSNYRHKMNSCDRIHNASS